MDTPPRKISRRRLLIDVGAGVGVLAVGTYVLWPEPPPKPPLEGAEAVEDYLRKELPYLRHDDASIRKFAQQWAKDARPVWSGTVESYLLSTDFFLNGEDEHRPLMFVAFYDPYVSPCYNPLMNLGSRS